MFNAIETVTDAIVTDSICHNNVADDDNEGKRKEEKMIAIVGGGNSSSIAQQKQQSGKFSKRQISRELFVVNQDSNSNQCDKSDNDNNNHVGSNCELNKGRAHTPSATAVPSTSISGRSGNRRKFFPDSSSLSFGDVESPRFINASIIDEEATSSTPTPSSKMNRSIDEMSTPNSSFIFNNTTKSSFGGNSSRKSFDYSGNKNNNSISRRNTSSPFCLGDFINTSGASSSGKQGTSVGGKLRKFNLALIKSQQISHKGVQFYGERFKRWRFRG